MIAYQNDLNTWKQQEATYERVAQAASNAAAAYKAFNFGQCMADNPFDTSKCNKQEQDLKSTMQDRAAKLQNTYPHGGPAAPGEPTPPNCTPSHHSKHHSKPLPGPTPHHQTYNPLPIIEPIGGNTIPISVIVSGNPPTPKHADELPVIAVMGVLIMGLIYWGTTR